MELKFDFSDFNKKFDRIVEQTFPALIEKGLGVAMNDLLGDCIQEVPTVPLKEGWLRGSGSIFVQNKFEGTSAGIGGGKTKFANTDHGEMISLGKYVGVVGFNAPYAAKMHEGIDYQFTDPSSGAKYLESKIVRKKELYIKDIADTIKAG